MELFENLARRPAFAAYLPYCRAHILETCRHPAEAFARLDADRSQQTVDDGIWHHARDFMDYRLGSCKEELTRCGCDGRRVPSYTVQTLCCLEVRDSFTEITVREFQDKIKYLLSETSKLYPPLDQS